MFAGLLGFAVKHKISQQRSEAVGVNRCDQTLPDSKAQRAKQLNTYLRHIRFLHKNCPRGWKDLFLAEKEARKRSSGEKPALSVKTNGLPFIQFTK
jgi:hypothetical protein